ncbi:hypothetical protein IJG27_04035 [Candidatus Saccharibacteria bacterium]|nr:hypothetical protein [Candidatus Saccharibacteria bacterium]MBQ6409649.1 hypothetical protein [Candidatus Saccharibacteria bacterium]
MWNCGNDDNYEDLDLEDFDIEDYDNYDLIFNKASEYGKKYHPDAPSEHHVAFANSVAYAVTGETNGHSGVSMRERLAHRLILGSFGFKKKRCTFDQAAELLDGCCYGMLTVQHAMIFDSERCYNDAPGEPEIARNILAATM